MYAYIQCLLMHCKQQVTLKLTTHNTLAHTPHRPTFFRSMPAALGTEEETGPDGQPAPPQVKRRRASVVGVACVLFVFHILCLQTQVKRRRASVVRVVLVLLCVCVLFAFYGNSGACAVL